MKSKSSPQSFPEQPSFSDDPILEMLGEELSEDEKNCLNDAAASLAYDVPSLPLNPNLKNRLFENLGLELPDVDILSLLKLSLQELQAQSETLDWESMEDAPGFDMAMWQEDSQNRVMACFIRAEKAGSFPDHYHPAEEEIVVLAGDIVEGDRVYRAGERLKSAPDTSHQLDTTQGCLLFCVASMDNRFLE